MYLYSFYLKIIFSAIYNKHLKNVCVNLRMNDYIYLSSKNNPAVPNDIYKIALVHENSPNMSKKEVQRKIFDGEISDKLLTIPYWKQAKSQTQVNQDQSHETPIQKSDKKEVQSKLVGLFF